MKQLTWAEFKSIYQTQLFEIRYLDIGEKYFLWGTDGYMTIYCEIDIYDSAPTGSDQKDFEDNFINNADVKMNDTAYGKANVSGSTRPTDTVTYFTSAADDQGMSDGNPLIFCLTAQDTNKVVDLTFSEDVWVKDGMFWCNDTTPVGSFLDIEVVHPVSGVVGSFGRTILLMPGEHQLNSDDRGLLPQGMILRCRVNNSDGNGCKDAAAAFKVVGRIEMFRKNTV